MQAATQNAHWLHSRQAKQPTADWDRELGSPALLRHRSGVHLRKSASQELAHCFSFCLPLSTHTATRYYHPKPRTSTKQPQDLVFRSLQKTAKTNLYGISNYPMLFPGCED